MRSKHFHCCKYSSKHKIHKFHKISFPLKEQETRKLGSQGDDKCAQHAAAECASSPAEMRPRPSLRSAGHKRSDKSTDGIVSRVWSKPVKVDSRQRSTEVVF